MGTQVTVMVSNCNRKVITSLKATLEQHFNRVELIEDDLAIVCKSNKTVTYLDVERMIHIYRDYIEDLSIKAIEDEPMEELDKEYGFTTAYDMIEGSK